MLGLTKFVETGLRRCIEDVIGRHNDTYACN